MCLIPYQLAEALQRRFRVVAAASINDPALAEFRRSVLDRCHLPQDSTAAIDTVHRLQRLYFTAELSLLDHPDMVAALLDEGRFPYWADFAALDATRAEKDVLAQQLYDGHAPLGPVALFIGDYARGIAEEVLRHCLDHKDEFDIWIDDRIFARRILHCVDRAGAIRYGELLGERYATSQRRIVVLAESPSRAYADPMPAEELEKLRYDSFMTTVKDQWLKQKFTGSNLPSRLDAEMDGIDYDEYVRIFFAMCAIDMDKINAAHQILIALLNPAETVHITNSDGTDITFGITGMTFENSLIDYNIPGTEVFSAPLRDQVNGTIVAKGWFNIPLASDRRIRDITLDFKDGRIIRAEAAEGDPYLQETIAKDAGSCYLGEFALGTNPALTRHVSNGLLVEKIGGSFHVALGNSYPNTLDAIINNGNESVVHWDITTMLRGRDGMIAVDDTVIMQGGRYLDPRLAYLNRED